MPFSTPLRRVSVYLEGLRLSLAIGAAWDLTLAAALLLAPVSLAGQLDVPAPAPTWLLPFVAVLLAGHALVSLLVVVDPISYRGNAMSATIVRLARAGALAVGMTSTPDLAGLLPLVFADGLLGLLHGFGWWRALR